MAEQISFKKQSETQEQLIQTDKLASLGVLVAGVAHEINNPNHTIMSNTNRVIEAWQSIIPILDEYYENNGDFVMGGLSYTEMRDEMPSCLKGISDSTKRIDCIVSGLKDFARREDCNITTDVDINVVIDSAVTLSSNYIKKATKNFTVTSAKNLPHIKGNFQRLEQVLINLILNACQALRNNEKAISVTTFFNSYKKCVEIQVKDEGIGISSEKLPQVKDPFYTTKREKGGTGLGLSISSTIISDHNGVLDIDSKSGKGTTATIILPVSENNEQKK